MLAMKSPLPAGEVEHRRVGGDVALQVAADLAPHGLSARCYLRAEPIAIERVVVDG